MIQGTESLRGAGVRLNQGEDLGFLGRTDVRDYTDQSLTSISLCGEEPRYTMRQAWSPLLSRYKRSPVSALWQRSRLRGKAGKMC